MSPAMIVLAGSSVVGATLRANTRFPPFFGVPDAELLLLETDDDEEELPLLDDPPHAASRALRPNTAAPPWPPRISRSRRVSSLSRYGMSGSFRSESAQEKSGIIGHNRSGSKLVSIAGVGARRRSSRSPTGPAQDDHVPRRPRGVEKAAPQRPLTVYMIISIEFV